MRKAFCSASLLWLVFACLHTVFASGQNYKIEEASHSFSSLCSFKPLPKLRYIDAKDLYKYKPSTGIFLNQSTSNLIDQESNWSQMLGFDPVRFSLKVSKDSLRIDEEFEIVITAEYIKINPRAIFTLESFNEYTLRLLIPEGFINTGGDYYDFIKGKVSENSHKQIYTLKGKFVNISNSSCFTLLRSHNEADVNSFFIKKAQYCITVSEDHKQPVLDDGISNLTEKFVAHRAHKLSIKHTLPNSLKNWQIKRLELIKNIEQNAGIYNNSDLPLNMKVHGEQQLEGYKIQNITFQVRKGVYATANLFIPDNKGPSPAVLDLHGHNATGRFDANVQYPLHKLARNGFVCLSIDSWGSGERSTQHGIFDYHGGNLGANLFDIGETLLGAQVMDNRRAIDLLISLSFVDKNNIGVTGESGGGNQTLWIAALDERLKAAVPVVGIGTFEAYSTGHSCVCSVLPKGLTFAEESDIVALIAPRYIRIYSANQDSNPILFPSEMLKTYNRAKPVFSLYQKTQNISYQRFDAPHTYSVEMADSMVVWFSRILKNIPHPSIQLITFPINPSIIIKQWVFEKGKRPADIKSTSVYCSEKSLSLKSQTTNHPKEEIERLFSLKNNPAKDAIDFEKTDVWQMIELADLHKLPVYVSAGKEPKNIVLHLFNKVDLSKNIEPDAINIWVGLFGKSEQTSPLILKYDNSIAELHTLAKSNLWVNESSIGIWYSEIKAVVNALKKRYPILPISIKTEKEIAIAAILHSIDEPMIKQIETSESPLSYVFDSKLIGYDKGYMGSHIPGLLTWGDLSDLVAFSNADISFNNARSFAGRKLDLIELEAFKTEFVQKRALRNNQSFLKFN